MGKQKVNRWWYKRIAQLQDVCKLLIENRDYWCCRCAELERNRDYWRDRYRSIARQ